MAKQGMANLFPLGNISSLFIPTIAALSTYSEVIDSEKDLCSAVCKGERKLCERRHRLHSVYICTGHAFSTSNI